MTESNAPEDRKTLRIAIAGIGVGAKAVMRALRQLPHFELVAAADLRKEARDTFERTFHGRTYDSVEDLCADSEVDIVWVSTPNHLHCEHTLIAVQAGKHVVVEKPMALNLDEAERMADAAERGGVQLMCGHTASLMPAYQAMRDVIRSGELGEVRAINVLSYNDWMLRARMDQELDVSLGGGIVYRQGPHQVDTVRLLGGGMVRSVRAVVGQWMPARSAPGYYAAFLTFEDGTPATIIRNGYGYFTHHEFVPWVERSRTAQEVAKVRTGIRDGTYDDDAKKSRSRFGGSPEPPQAEARARRPSGFHNDLGIVIATCERGDIRQSPEGLWLYDDSGQHEVVVEGIHDGRVSELDELHRAITEGRPVRHDARWGMATLEVVLAFMQSSQEGREIMLSHQCPAY